MTQPGSPADPHPLPNSAPGAAAIVDHLLTRRTATRSELASVTGLGRTAVSALLHRLVGRGVVIEADGAPGPRGARVRLAVADHLVLAAGVAGDEAVAALVEVAGTEYARYEEPVAFDDEDPRGATAAPLDALAIVVDRAVARAARDERRLATAGIVVQGAVAGSPELAVLDDAFGLEPADVIGALRDRSERLAGVEPAFIVPAFLVSAPAARAADEAAARGIAVVLHVTGEPQVAAGIAIAGMPYVGAHGLAATIGHLPVVPDGVRCGCGQRGCLATVASPRVILERAELADVERHHGRRAALDELTARVAEAEDRARWAWLDAAFWIGRALQMVVPSIDPGVITVGGWWAPLVGDIEAAFRDNRPSLGGGALASIPPIVAATTVGSTGSVAMRQARERLRSTIVAAATA
ncbi:ROK family protein [Agromyces sp. NPDC056523]|uniref:ROK family protein n=1 Tax=Agromyces sp. NPDC056523 TaxID=3345850 RepID=UPI00366ECE94